MNPRMAIPFALLVACAKPEPKPPVTVGVLESKLQCFAVVCDAPGDHCAWSEPMPCHVEVKP